MIQSCNGYVGKLAVELDRLLKIEEEGGAVEASRLRRELDALKKAKDEADKRIAEVLEQKKFSAEKVSTLLSENSNLIFECGDLSAAAKVREVDLANLKLGVTKLKEESQVAMEAMKGEKCAVEGRLRVVEAQLTRSQEESVKSFEDGYQACWGRLVDAGCDVAAHSFENYLVDFEKIVCRDGVESSNQLGDKAV